MTADTTTTATELCPPNPDAYCICGEALSDHRTADPDDAPTLGDAECPYDLADAFWDKRPAIQFRLADAETLDCPQAIACVTCDHPLCPDHSSEFSVCVSDGYHCRTCVDRCRSCHHTEGF